MNQRTQEAIRQIYHIFSGADACNKTTQENGRICMGLIHAAALIIAALILK